MDLGRINETVYIPSGTLRFRVAIEYHKRKVSYSLTLVNNRTKNKKVIEGKWIEIALTGGYEIIWEKAN